MQESFLHEMYFPTHSLCEGQKWLFKVWYILKHKFNNMDNNEHILYVHMYKRNFHYKE